MIKVARWPGPGNFHNLHTQIVDRSTRAEEHRNQYYYTTPVHSESRCPFWTCCMCSVWTARICGVVAYPEVSFHSWLNGKATVYMEYRLEAAGGIHHRCQAPRSGGKKKKGQWGGDARWLAKPHCIYDRVEQESSCHCASAYFYNLNL